jgi:hypothetical protein
LVNNGFYDAEGNFVEAHTMVSIFTPRPIRYMFNEIYCLEDQATFVPLPYNPHLPFKLWECAQCKRQITKQQIKDSLSKAISEIERDIPVTIKLMYSHRFRIESSEYTEPKQDRRYTRRKKTLTEHYIESVNARIKQLVCKDLNIKLTKLGDLFP